MKIVTGASGFIGSFLVSYLEQRGHEVVKLPRPMLASPLEFLSGCDVLIHLAGIAHRRKVSFAQMDEVNRKLPVSLAKCAEEASVKKFIFVSSVAATVSPDTPYGRSKAMAESDLLALDGIEVTVARPPLVYGRGAPGNMRSLLLLSKLPCHCHLVPRIASVRSSTLATLWTPWHSWQSGRRSAAPSSRSPTTKMCRSPRLSPLFVEEWGDLRGCFAPRGWKERFVR